MSSIEYTPKTLIRNSMCQSGVQRVAGSWEGSTYADIEWAGELQGQTHLR